MRAYFEIGEQRGGMHDPARFPFVVEVAQGDVEPSVHESGVECDDDGFDANWAMIVAQDRSRPERPRYTLLTKVIREVQEPCGLRVASENASFSTEAIITEVAVASRSGLGEAA
jgi:hypothetical protein